MTHDRDCPRWPEEVQVSLVGTTVRCACGAKAWRVRVRPRGSVFEALTGRLRAMVGRSAR